MFRKTVLAVALISTSAFGSSTLKLVPSFGDRVPGKDGSIWQSELRLYNGSQTPQVVRVERVLPALGITCTGFEPITLEPGALAQIRSVGCPPGSIAAVEVSLDDSVEMTSVITNTGSALQDPCCLTGYAQNIPVLPTATAYSTSHTLANLQIPGSRQAATWATNLGRHNFIFVNPNDQAASVALRYFDATGALWNGPPVPYTQVILGPHSYTQFNDAFPQLSLPFETPVLTGWFRVEAAADMPFYMFDSYIDNSTNDATTIESR